jgi:serine/threonine protein kinase
VQDEGMLVDMSLEREQNEPGLCLMTSANNCNWFIRSKDLHIGKKIGSGSTATVHASTWLGSHVAAKRFKKTPSNEEQLLDCRCETGTLSSLRHQNVLMFIGACFVSDRFVIVTELMENGSLKEVLQKTAAFPLTWKQRLRMAYNIASGLAYLHQLNPPVLHRDLKSSNLLVDGVMNVKLADFGFARLKQDGETMTRCGTPCWTAPEILQNSTYNEKADIYSLGVVLWELLTRKVPYSDSNFMKVTLDVIAGRRPEIPGDCPIQYKELIRACWAHEPELRPSADMVLACIRSLLGDDADDLLLLG